MNDTPTQPVQQSRMSTWSLVLGIIAFVLAVFIFISIPAAIIAVIFGIIVLVKHRPGRGSAIAGIIIGGVTLLLIPPLAALSLVAYNSITKRVNMTNESSQLKGTNKISNTVANGSKVDTQCFTYIIPSGYEFDVSSKNCTTAVNIHNGDDLTRVTVKGNTGAIGSLKDVVASFNKTLQAGNPNVPGVVDQKELILQGRSVYYITYKDTTGLLYGNYIISDKSGNQTVNSKIITAYTVAGYVYNSSLAGIVRNVFDSLTIK